jgi:hypothetical protein
VTTRLHAVARIAYLNDNADEPLSNVRLFRVLVLQNFANKNV